MTTGTLTLAAFLLARIAEDEAVAERLRGGSVGDPWGWQPKPHPMQTATPARRVAVTPARVLAECEAKRRIVERCIAEPYDCSRAHPTMDVYHPDGHADEDPTLRALAAVYADHEDYRQEWRP